MRNETTMLSEIPESEIGREIVSVHVCKEAYGCFPVPVREYTSKETALEYALWERTVGYTGALQLAVTHFDGTCDVYNV